MPASCPNPEADPEADPEGYRWLGLRAVFCQAPAHPLRGLTSIPRKSSKRPAFFAGGLKARSWGGTGTGSLLPSRSYLKFTEWHHFLTFLHCTPSTCHGTQLAQDALPALALQAAGIVMGTKADRIGHRSTDTGPYREESKQKDAPSLWHRRSPACSDRVRQAVGGMVTRFVQQVSVPGGFVCPNGVPAHPERLVKYA